MTQHVLTPPGALTIKNGERNKVVSHLKVVIQ